MGALGVNQVLAQSTTSGPFSNLVQMIADKFNMNKNDVQQVFDQYRLGRRDTMEKNYEAYLDQLVKDGKITQAQKDLILAKHKEIGDVKQKISPTCKT